MTDPRILDADERAQRYLAAFNARIEAGKDDAKAHDLFMKAQFWLDRLNRLTGNGD